MKNELKPKNTWSSEGMGYDWRKNSPLNGAERYLWEKLKSFPEYDHWSAEARESRSALHVWYEEGWSFLHHIQDNLFCASSVCGTGGHPPFENKTCEWGDCLEAATCLTNSLPVDRSNRRGAWKWLDDAPVFHCFAHHMELGTGAKYVPPTEEERHLTAAQFRAMERMHNERPPEKVTLDSGLTIDSFVMMDYDYLKRLAELTKEEFDKLRPKIQ